MPDAARLAHARDRLNRAVDALEAQLDALEAEIEETRAELEAALPVASVHFKYKKCGSDCRCNDGRGHGPYAYASFRDATGQVRQRYLGKDPRLPDGAMDKRTYRRMQRRLRELRRRRDDLWSRIDEAVRLLESFV